MLFKSLTALTLVTLANADGGALSACVVRQMLSSFDCGLITLGSFVT